MSSKQIWLVLTLLALFLAQECKAAAISHSASIEIRPTLNVTQLTKDASLIIVGQVLSLREESRGEYEFQGQTVSGRKILAALRVARVLKGEANNEVFVRFISFSSRIGDDTINAGQFGMFFLRDTPDGLGFASSYYPFLHALRDGCPSEGRGLPAVVSELGCVLQSASTGTAERVKMIDALMSVDTVEANLELKRAVQHLPRPLKELAAAVLASHNDLSALWLLEEAMQHSSKLEITGQRFSSTYYLSSFLERVRNTEAIPTLGRLMDAADVGTRRGAVQALRNIGTAGAIEPLLKGLEDSDQEVRWIAVMGLAGIVGPDKEDNSWYPSHDAFRQNERLYLNHWREWAERRKR